MGNECGCRRVGPRIDAAKRDLMEEIQEAERELADALALVKNAGRRATPCRPVRSACIFHYCSLNRLMSSKSSSEGGLSALANAVGVDRRRASGRTPWSHHLIPT